VDGHARGCGELFVAHVALEVLRFLVLNQDFLVVEFPVTVVAKHLLHCSLLLLPHIFSSSIHYLIFKSLLSFLLMSNVGFRVRVSIISREDDDRREIRSRGTVPSRTQGAIGSF
jgi:hypothetical protein